jgi:proteasome assembly chaperone (PAC2) family protein
MPTELTKWVTDIGAEMRLRVDMAALDARTRRIDDLLKIIAEREAAAAHATSTSPR